MGLLALLVGLVSWLEPVRLSIQLGQINLLILAVVVTDILAPKRWRLAGIGIGIVAGIKLTPMIFIVFLFVVGRIRAAVVATVTLIATVGLGFIFLPSASHYYWVDRSFEKISRITRDPTASTSISGLFLRLDLSAGIATALSALVIVMSLVVATLAYRRNQLLLAISIVGMASAAASRSAGAITGCGSYRWWRTWATAATCWASAHPRSPCGRSAWCSRPGSRV